MGQYLSSPKVEPEILDGEELEYAYGMCSIQGWRKEMEDMHIIAPNIVKGVSLFAVMDGHGGKEVAIFTRKHFPFLLKEKINKGGDLANCLRDSMKQIDSMLLTNEGKKELHAYRTELHASDTITLDEVGQFCGCTCCALLITEDRIIAGNIGDSRAIIYRGKLCFPITEDHKPDVLIEKKRIERAHGFVEANRVNGHLNISRTIGDLNYKNNGKLLQEDQCVTCLPDIINFARKEDDDFIIIACDGIWECLNCQQAAEIASDLISKYKELKISNVLYHLFQRIVSKNVALSGGLGADNMTAILIKLKNDRL